ncbi:general transcription factor 3C polypeptide 1 [Cephus cinctus]|uniref:General transcription factor 3C polypeptide 1 n=1 Tax=Cephus cinctus TaxID=211228 RepID=A0AAJ7CEC5_CEPCN|nr:general transcription factor 3C polypeptide 1 [Cephus cinctus]
MASLPTINLVDAVIDEISLEGLDGITVEALWKRLSLRLHNPLPFSQSFIEQLWGICLQIRELRFYKLESPREKLVIFDRYEYVDPDLGMILEPANVPNDIYPHCPIEDSQNGIKGSCATYYTRKDISSIIKTLSLQDIIQNYEQTLVIVASQKLRECALMGYNVCPTLELTVMQYCFLERVGRARYHGEVTQGKLSLNSLKEDPKSLFYHRKYLLRHKLITKQLHHQKSGGHCYSGSLLHLPRFFVERKPKILYLADQVIEKLKSKDNYVAEYDEIRKTLQLENPIKKLFKTAFFQKVVRTDLRVPYRTLYPDAEDKEWQRRNNPTKEKTIRVIQLLDPNVDISELWGKDEVHEEEDLVDLDISNQRLNIPLLRQANNILEESGRDGLCQGKLAKKLGLTKLQSRMVLRNLVRSKIVATYMNDMGRQRLAKYVSKKFEESSKMSKQFREEVNKIKELSKTVNFENEKSAPAIEKYEEPERTQEENVTVIKTYDDSEEAGKTNIESDPVSVNEASLSNVESFGNRDKNLFRCANGIIRKYKVAKYCFVYKHTFLNVSQKKLTKSSRGKFVISYDIQRKEDKSIFDKKNTISKLRHADRVRAMSLFNSIKTKLVEQLPIDQGGKSSNNIVGFIEELHKNESKNISNITYRLLKRANMIIQSVKEDKVIKDMTKLMKMINEEEDREGYDVKIDKKSLIRLLQKLAKDNLVKNIKLTLSANGKEKSLTFICDPSINTNHTVIQSAVEQAKIKFCLVGSQNIKPITQNQLDRIEMEQKDSKEVDKDSKEVIPEKSKPVTTNLKYDYTMGKKYGYSPKFVRMQTLHALIYYVIYDHPGEQSATKEEQLAYLRRNGFLIDDALGKEMSTIYNMEVNWKMFIPPVPQHNGWPLGWTLMCDILLRIPLSCFLKVHNVPFVIPDLEYYVNHPIRKHFLVKDLPTNIRNTLLMARKYIFTIHESITRLCYIGLIQFGPQKLKEKDQVFLYLNRHAELLDTTSSAAGYHKIEEKEYPVMKYTFDSMQALEKYWYDMWNTCINTFLGGRLVVQGKDILLEDLGKKTEMIQAIRARMPHEACELDVGFVPGDRRGAAGLDSAFFAHLKRNWNWGNSYYIQRQYSKKITKIKAERQRSAYMSKIKAKPVKFTEFADLRKVTGPATVNATELKKRIQKREADAAQHRAKQKEYQTLVSCHSTKQKSFVRRVMPRKRKVRPRVKYDEIDFCALQRMDKLRVDWEPHEDNILLVCKVVMMYLCPNPRKQMITFISVRDVLRSYSPTSCNKTSRACQRRLLYMLRRPQTMNSVMLGVEEIKQNFYINKRFDGIVEKMKKDCQNPYEYEEQVAEVFKDLVAYVAKKYYDISDMVPREHIVLPKTIQEFNLLYKVKHPSKPLGSRGFTKDVSSINDIHSATINSVIHSSMCCGKDRTSWAYQLFKVYQQYPEFLLRIAMNKIRSDQMVSVKKSYMCAIKKYGNCMPMSSSQYQLSTGYIYKFQTKWPYEAFAESYDFLYKLTQWYGENQLESLNYAVPDGVDGIEAAPVTGGIVVAIHDYIAKGQLEFDIEVPDQIIMLDPRLQEKDETYLRIERRYLDILRSLEQLNAKKKRNVDIDLIDPEVEEEDEIERREFEDKVIGEKREKEDRDRHQYWKTRNDEVARQLEEAEIKEVRDTEDTDRRIKREKFDDEMMERKKKYRKVLEMGTDNLQEVDVSVFGSFKDFRVGSSLDQTDAERECVEADEDCDDDDDDDDFPDDIGDADDEDENHTIRFQDGTTITLSKEDIDRCDVDDASVLLKTQENKSKPSLKRSNGNNKDTVPKKKLRMMSDVEATDDEFINAQNKNSSAASHSEILMQKITEKSSENTTQVQNINKKRSRDSLTDSEINQELIVKKARTSSPSEINDYAIEIPDNKEISGDIVPSNAETITLSNPDDNSVVNTETNTSTIKSRDATTAVKVSDTFSNPNNSSARVNDIIKNIYNEMECESSSGKVLDLNDVQKRGTRIALLMMREELNDFALSDSHHAHEYFVVNTFKIFYSLHLPESKSPRELTDFHQHNVPREILPLNTNLAKKLIDDIKKYAIFPKDISYAEFKQSILELPHISLNDVDNVYKFVRSMKELGCTTKELLTKFSCMDEEILCEIVSLLTTHYLFLRSGVTTLRYIHWSYTEPWLIESYKILRLDKDSQPLIPKGSMYFADEEKQENFVIKDECSTSTLQDGPSTTADIVNDQKFVRRDLVNDNLEKDVESAETEQSNLQRDEGVAIVEDATVGTKKKVQLDTNVCITEEEHISHSSKRMQRNRISLLQQKDIHKAAKRLDFNSAEEIKVVIRPWIRIDGVLNRRVLDRMMGSVLAYCMMHPGAFLTKIQSRFMPALQPFHTRELVEMLVKIECLKVSVFKKPRVTLFSKSAPVIVDTPKGLETEEKLIVEPVIDASLRFGMFRSTKTYNVDFLS